MLLVAAWRRLLIAGAAVVGLWAAVLWVAPSTPSTTTGQAPVWMALPPAVPTSATGPLRAIIQSGAPAPGGGRFDRFDVTAQPIAAPVNARRQVAFYATVLHGAMILRFSERVAIDEAGEIAFGAHLGKESATREAVLRTGTEGLSEIAVEGAPAPGGGHYAGFGPWP